MNKLILIVAVALSLCSCSKENGIWVRNYQIPVDLNKPYDIAGGGSIIYEIGTPDSLLIQKIIDRENLTSEQIKYLSLTPYVYNSVGDIYELENPNPKYMRFPHSIMSTQDNWGWEHYYEYCEIGEQEFCNKYFDGEKTLGMTWGNINCN